MAKILVPRDDSNYYRHDILVDGNEIHQGILDGEYVEFHLPSCARRADLAQKAFRLSLNQVYVLMHITYNASSSVSIERIEGLNEIFSYGDYHGMRWGGLFKVVSDHWLLDFSVPAHHNHGEILCRFTGDKISFENKDMERTREEAEQV